MVRPHRDQAPQPHIRHPRRIPQTHLHRPVSHSHTVSPVPRPGARELARLTVTPPPPSLTSSLNPPLPLRGPRCTLPTSINPTTRPMNVTARGPGIRSWISTSAYSVSGVHAGGAKEGGRRADCNFERVKPSPTGAGWGGAEGAVLMVRCCFVGEGVAEGVGGKYAWIALEGLLFAAIFGRR